MFNHILLVFTYVYTGLPMITTVLSCLSIFRTDYSCMLTYVYPSLLVFTYDYTCLPMFTLLTRTTYV